MNLKRIGVLLIKEFVQGAKGFLFIFAIVVPVVLTLIVSLLFGTLFSGKPKMGISDAGNSSFTEKANLMDAFIVKSFDENETLEAAAASGAVDIGVAIPADFDQKISNGESTEMTAYIWGESLIKNRAMLIAGMATWVREIAGQKSPVDIQTKTLGEIEALSWEDRLVPLIVVMSVMIGGVMLTATSLVEEKQKHTMKALTVTPTTIGEIFAAKGLLGVIVSTITGVLTLLLNRSFGINPPLLIFLIFLGAVFVAEIGVLLGAYIKDINTLFATIKSMGIVLYAPAIIHMFPAIPQWIGKFFPTYYMIRPVIEVTQEGAGWGEIAWMVYVELGLIVLFGVGLGIISRDMRKKDA